MYSLKMHIFLTCFISFYLTFQICAGIGVTISKSGITFDNEANTHISTDEELISFGVTREAWKNYFAQIGRRTDFNEIYYRDPTPPNGNMFSEWGTTSHLAEHDDPNETVEPTKTISQFVEAKILEQSAVPEAVATDGCTNHLKDQDIQCSFKLSTSKSNTVTSSWTYTGGLSVKQDFKIRLSDLLSIGTDITLTASVGHTDTKSEAVTITTETGVVVHKVKPGKSIVANLISERGTMKVQIQYRVSLFGYTIIRGKHHTYRMPTSLALPFDKRTKYITQVVEIGSYSRGRIELVDGETQRVVSSTY